MISQKQNNFHRPEEETQPSPYQEQTAPAVSSWRDWSLWLRVLGVVVALMGPFTWALLFLQVFQSLNVLAALILLLVEVVSAGLIRSWWSLLIIPALFCLGLILNAFLTGGLTNVLDLLSWITSLKGLASFFIWVVPIVYSAAVGTSLGLLIEKRPLH